MNIAELRQALEAEGFDPQDYRLLEKPDENALCLERRHHTWLVYHFERGERFDLRRFSTEEAACEYFLNRMRGGPP